MVRAGQGASASGDSRFMTTNHFATGGPAMRVLFVDDHEDTAEVFEVVLEHAGVDVEIATNGADALTKLLHQGPFDVAIIDLALPVVDGYEVARRARETLGPRCPYLIALTGLGLNIHREAAIKAGFDRFVVKPIDRDALLLMIAER